MSQQLRPVREGLLLGIVTVAFGWGLGIAFGAAEDTLKGGLKASAEAASALYLSKSGGDSSNLASLFDVEESSLSGPPVGLCRGWEGAGKAHESWGAWGRGFRRCPARPGDDRAVSRTGLAPPPPPRSTAAHPRAFRGTKHKPPKANAPGDEGPAVPSLTPCR
jgi:hypothetical protein